MVSVGKRKKRRNWAVISVGAAMADIALLLLVFFMATTTTEPPKGVEVDLPRAQTEGAEQDNIYISIGRNGRIYYDHGFVTLDNLKDQLALRMGEKDRVVAITADKNLPYATIQKVLNLLKELDFLNVVFMSQPKADSGVTP